MDGQAAGYPNTDIRRLAAGIRQAASDSWHPTGSENLKGAVSKVVKKTTKRRLLFISNASKTTL